MWCTHKGGLVIHRIGGLEINVLNESRTLEVIHRIGGLERFFVRIGREIRLYTA